MSLQDWAHNSWLRAHQTSPQEIAEHDHDRAGVASEPDATELVAFCEELRQAVIEWLAQKHPTLVPPKT